MSNEAAKTPAAFRISELLDAGSFVEIGGAVTARSTDFNMQESKVPGDGVITGYGVIDGSLVCLQPGRIRFRRLHWRDARKKDHCTL